MGLLEKHEGIAERIIEREAFEYALCKGVGEREARGRLKHAIVMALGTEFSRGAELQRRSMESNAEIDRIERDLGNGQPPI
jgi:hypothetical protein